MLHDFESNYLGVDLSAGVLVSAGPSNISSLEDILHCEKIFDCSGQLTNKMTREREARIGSS